MFESRFEILGWLAAILIVVVMAILVFTGPYHNVNKTSAAPPVSSELRVQILTDPKTIGRYDPPTITARVGQPIIFTNNSNLVHTVTAQKEVNGALPFNSGDIGTGGHTFTFTPTQPGTFAYICIYHPLMKGTITVNS